MTELCRQAATDLSHPGDPVAVLADRIKVEIIIEVGSATNTSTHRVIWQQLADVSQEFLQRLPRKSALRQQLEESVADWETTGLSSIT